MTEAFTAAHERFESRRSGDPAWVRALRREAWDGFTRSGLPTRALEDWKYTSVRPVSDLTFAPAASERTTPEVTRSLAAALEPLIDTDDLTLVMVDGVLSPELSRLDALPAGLTVTPLADAWERRCEGLREQLTAALAAERHPFALLGASFLHQGLDLEIAPRTVVQRPIHIVHLVTAEGGGQAAAYFPRHLVRLGERAEATLVETFVAVGEASYLVTSTTELSLAEGANLRHLRLQSEGRGGLHFGVARAQLARDAQLATFSFAAGARLARFDLNVALTGPGAEVALDGLYLTRDHQHVDHHTVVEHQVPHATSRQLYKGILDDASRAVFNGKIVVREGAHGTNAHQLNQNLLLTSDAEIDTKPELAIDADDVKCAHGAAIGQLSQDQLFYLQSRGLPPGEARQLLLSAFADEALLRVPVTGKLARLRRLTREYFAR